MNKFELFWAWEGFLGMSCYVKIRKYSLGWIGGGIMGCEFF